MGKRDPAVTQLNNLMILTLFYSITFFFFFLFINDSCL